MLCVQDYKTKKHQRLRQKISDQLQQSVAQSGVTSGGHDLGRILAAHGGLDAGAGLRGKGSRFARVEKLQFAQVA